MKNLNLELYTDYLICSQGNTTATGLSEMLDGVVSHDKFTRMLSHQDFTSKELWQLVKPIVREIESDEGVLIFDDTIQEKAWMEENDLICWHYDHSKGRNVKGVNLLNVLYHSNNYSIPVAFELIKKTEKYQCKKTNKQKRKSEHTKNEHMRAMLNTCCGNQLKFRYVLTDSWFASSENFTHIRKKGKHFISALKSNRGVAFGEDKANFVRISEANIPKGQAVQGWIRGYESPVMLIHLHFTNKDDSTGELYLACSDLTCDFAKIVELYQKRWKVEEFHKSLKSNTSLGKSPSRTVRTQSNHIFMSIYAAFKLEVMNLKQKLNPFTLSRKLFIKATRFAFDELRHIRLTA